MEYRIIIIVEFKTHLLETDIHVSEMCLGNSPHITLQLVAIEKASQNVQCAVGTHRSTLAVAG